MENFATQKGLSLDLYRQLNGVDLSHPVRLRQFLTITTLPGCHKVLSPLVHSTTFDNFEDCEIGTNLKSRNSPGRIRRTTKLVIRNACVSCKKARAKVRIHVTGLILLRMYAQRGCVQSFRTMPIQNVDSFLSVMAKSHVYGVHLDFRLQNVSTKQRSTSKEK